MPAYTHSESRSDGLKPMNSVRSVLNSIPRRSKPGSIQNHDLQAATQRAAWRGAWDASSTIPTITCDGGTRGHPDGERALTERELAALQSFPNSHAFLGSAIKKQIGNAVPPMIAEKLFRAIIDHLQKADKAETIRKSYQLKGRDG